MLTEPVWEFALADHLLLAPSYSNDLYLLNPTAALAWVLLRDGATLPEAAASFSHAFNVSSEVAQRDIEAVWSNWKTTVLARPSAAGGDIPKLVLKHPSIFDKRYAFNDRWISVVLHDESLIHEIVPRLSHLEGASASEFGGELQITLDDKGCHLFSNGTWVATEEEPADIRVLFLQEFVRLAHPGFRWMGCLHAAACGAKSRCVILAGETHSGKTTLAAVLMHSGLTLYSEDTVPIEASRFAIPSVPSALMIREPSWPLVSERFPDLVSIPAQERYGQRVKFLPPRQADSSTTGKAIALVFCQWEAGSVPITPLRLNTADAFARLISTGFWLAHDKAIIGKFCEWIQSLAIYEITYSDVAAAAEFVERIITRDQSKG